jgi:hypothetical protein
MFSPSFAVVENKFVVFNQLIIPIFCTPKSSVVYHSGGCLVAFLNC